MLFKILYIDDEISEIEKYKKIFLNIPNISYKVQIDAILTPIKQEQYNRLKHENYDVMLIDFDLSVPNKIGEVSNITGLTLSTQLRQDFPNTAIIIFTKKNLFSKKTPIPIQTIASLDEIIYKHKIFEENDTFEIICSLAFGYRKLRDSKIKKWDDVFALMNVPNIETNSELLRISNPQLFSSTDSISRYSNISSWIRKLLMVYPGILYDAVFSATLLGISKSEFLSKELQNKFQTAEYNGIFSNGKKSGKKRWWKSSLYEIAINVIEEANIKLTKIKENFPDACKQLFKREIEVSKCIVSKETLPDSVCYILNEPMKIEYSLRYIPDKRPSIMDEARISHTAILKTNTFNENLMDDLSKKELKRIKKKRR